MINEKIRFRAFLKDIRADNAVMGWTSGSVSYCFIVPVYLLSNKNIILNSSFFIFLFKIHILML